MQEDSRQTKKHMQILCCLKHDILILLCKGTACHVNGADGIEKALAEELGVGDGETTQDGLFSIKTVACLGCCSLSPVMMINEDTYGSLTPEKAKEIVRRIKAEAAAK